MLRGDARFRLCVAMLKLRFFVSLSFDAPCYCAVSDRTAWDTEGNWLTEVVANAKVEGPCEVVQRDITTSDQRHAPGLNEMDLKGASHPIL